MSSSVIGRPDSQIERVILSRICRKAEPEREKRQTAGGQDPAEPGKREKAVEEEKPESR